MAKFKTAIIVGSLRKESINLKLAKAIVKLGSGQIDASFPQFGDFPLFNQDLESDFPAQVARFKKEIEVADAVLFVTPEYNRGLPGVLKNAIDWATRPAGQNSFAGKPAAVCGTSPGQLGTISAQHHLKATLLYFDMMLMGSPEVFLQFREGLIDADGTINDERTKQFLQKFTDKFIGWVEAYKNSDVHTAREAKRNAR